MARRTAKELANEGRLAAEVVELFMFEHLRFTGGPLAGRAMKLAPFQREHIVRPVFGTLDAKGKRVYREAIVGLPRWGGKSQLSAALGLTLLYTEPTFEGEYYVVATTKQQAGIVFEKAKRMVLMDDLLRGITRVYRSVLEIRETGALFRVLPWDADTAQGYHPTAAIIDEYHVHRDASMREAMLSGMVGTEQPLLITITTAGPERKGPLWDLLQTAPRDPRAYIYWAGAPDGADGRDPKVWRAANPHRWITAAMLRDQYRTLPFPVFERLHLNRFPSSGTNRAYPAELWDPCDALPDFDPRLPTMLALDASWTRDTTALVAAQRSPAGLISVLAFVWRKDGAMGHIDHEAVEAKIVELCRDFNVVRIGCDPNYFTRSMLRLEHDFRLPIEEFPQENKRMSSAAMTLFDVLQERRLAHGGERRLREQVMNAGVKPTPHGWRLTKVTDDAKIDAAVALAMAVYLAESEANAFAPSFAQTGGVRTIQLGA
jgi:phage terminase large subunit-like protein